jgi:hypothetical protein
MKKQPAKPKPEIPKVQVESLEPEVESLKSQEISPEQVLPAYQPLPENTKSSVITELPTENSKLPTETMEVHHHPDVEKKGLKEYLLEGLMIFIAVTMGFFAESLQEHLGEHAKEHEYVVNIKKDFIADTVHLNIWLPSMYKRIGDLDTLIALLKTKGNIAKGADMYYYARLATRAGEFESDDNTVQELKSSGNFRLIRDEELKGRIMNFERSINNYKSLYSIEAQEREMISALVGDLFDATIFDKMSGEQTKANFSEKDFATGSKFSIKKPNGNPQLISNNKEEINKLIYYLHQRKSSIFGEARILTDQKLKAKQLIDGIDKFYELGNE